MAYFFKGIITKIDKLPPEKVKETFIPKAFEFFEPFHGLCWLATEADDEKELILKSKLYSSQMFMFMNYNTWGGEIDFVSGYVFQNGETIDSTVQNGEAKKAEEIFKNLFLNIGHEMEGTFFKPFEKGFFVKS